MAAIECCSVMEMHHNAETSLSYLFKYMALDRICKCVHCSTTQGVFTSPNAYNILIDLVF